MNQRLALLQLRKLGFQAHAVNNGREAVEAAMSGDYALVLMDCQMPELDGFAATTAIRAVEASRTQTVAKRPARPLPIVAMTANAMHGDREACLAAGMDDYIPKPVKVEQLREVLARWLAPEYLDASVVNFEGANSKR